MIASNAILGADGSPADKGTLQSECVDLIANDGKPFITGGAPRRIPVVGGPLDGVKLPRKTEQPKMAVEVHATTEADPPLWLAHEYRDGAWRFIGWMDGTKRIVAVEGSAEYEAICADRADQLDSIRSMATEIKHTAKPVKFEGQP